MNSAIVAYFMDDLQINKHFTLFKKLLFMEDGEFSLSLSNQLFEKVCDDFCSSLQLLAYLDVPCPTCLNFFVGHACFCRKENAFFISSDTLRCKRKVLESSRL